MPTLAELQAALFSARKQLTAAANNEESQKAKSAEMDSMLPVMRNYMSAESDRIEHVLRTVQTDLARIASAERFRQRFEDDVRSILRGAPVRNAFGEMESAVQAVQSGLEAANKAALSALNEKKSLQSRIRDLERQIREQQQTGGMAE